MTALAESIDLADLAARFDEASRKTFVSLFADLSDPDHKDALDARADEIRAALGDADAVAIFDAAYEAALEALASAAAEDGSRGVAAFAAPEHDFVEAHPLAQPIGTRLVLDSSPYVRPLARFMDAYECFVLVLLDSEDAVVHLVVAARPEQVAEESAEVSRRHNKGGMSQMRYQRHRQGVLDKLLDDVAEHVRRLMEEEEVERVVVAGPGTAKRELADLLSAFVDEDQLHVEDADLDGASDDEHARRMAENVRRESQRDARAALGEVREGLLGGGLAMTGPVATARAARDGRVDTLVVLKGHRVAGAKCEEHQEIFREGEACPCGVSGNVVDVLNEAVEYAIRAESDVEFVDEDEFLRSVGGVAATLRW